ncbi:MAG TPA: hypothetical protein VNR65_04720 [Geobacterales bacterium]|nr:hypothetical protein [Geobacterales bacterium]
MDPDIVRQQEDAERAAAGLPPKKPVNGSADPVQSRHAVSQAQATLDTPEPIVDTPETIVPLPEEQPIVSARQSFNPNRRALPPIGSGRQPWEEAPPRRRVRGLLRLFLYAIAGAALGGILGFVGVSYFHLFVDQAQLFISSMAGGFALLFGLTHLLHYDA